jgi:hypothetical protein
MTLRDQFAATCAAGLLACYAKNSHQEFPYRATIYLPDQARRCIVAPHC